MHPAIRALLVEDNPTDQLLTREALDEAAWLAVDLVCVARLQDALGRLGQEPFDVVLLDLGLPDSQGMETFLTLQGHDSDVPVVVLTGHADEALGMQLVREGAQDYLVKGALSGPSVVRAVRYAVERRRAQRALQEADRRKNEFLAMLAHELRNPLAPIQSAVELMALIGPGDPRLARAREVVARQVRHLSRLVDDLLDLSRVTLGKIGLQTAPVDLRDVVARALEQAGPLLEARRHRVTLELPDAALQVEVDAARLAQVLANLLTNAAKYTPEEGHIDVLAGREGDEVVVRVRDDGVGIPGDLLGQVFDLFVQAERSLDRADGGLGIGLTLARAIVELHGGRIEARSGGPGRGSEFVVYLPARAAPQPATPAPEEAPAVRRRRILVVEDNPDTAATMEMLLGIMGHDVAVAGDGFRALALAASFRPEVVLLDVGLPGLDGYGVAERLRSDPLTRDVLLVALTGYASEEHRKRAVDAGFDHHLVKPVDAATLEALLA